MPPDVSVRIPADWASAEIARPSIAASTGAEWISWHAARAPDDGATVVRACVRVPIPGWVDDMRPAFTDRTIALAGAAAERIAGAPVETFDDPALGQDVLGLRPVGASTAHRLGSARPFVGFDGADALTCFVACAGQEAQEPDPCRALAAGARLEGGSPPPPPGAILRATAWAVHHPRPVSYGMAAASIALGFLAVATRRRPRART